MIKIMIVDDHDLIRAGIALLLLDLPNIEVVATAGTGEEAILLTRKYNPDVIFMDIRMPGIGGISAIQKIVTHHPQIKIIALTSCTEEPFPTNILKAGAHGYLTKGTTLEKMAQAIHSVMASEKFIDPNIAQKLAFKNISDISSSPFEVLSIREFNVVMMLSNGLSHKVIAEKLFISIKTLNSCRYKIYEKLNVKNDTQIILFARQHDLLELV